jgi:hypothetical protein
LGGGSIGTRDRPGAPQESDVPRLTLYRARAYGFAKGGILMRAKAVFFMPLISLIASCSYTGPSQVASGSDVGGTGNVQYDHKRLNATTHLLTVHVSPGLLESEGSMAARMEGFASQFAARTCPTRFDFVTNPTTERNSDGIVERTKVYTFRCS